MISATREQLEQARRVCERQAAPDARLWRVVLRTPPAFDEDPNAPAELSKEPELAFERVGGQWILRGSVRIVPEKGLPGYPRPWQTKRNARPHVVVYQEAPADLPAVIAGR